MKTTPITDLKTGDVVQLFEGAFGTAIVQQATDTEIVFWRPYGTTSGFTMSNNRTICYIGTELVHVQLPSNHVYSVLYHNPQR